ncbi:conserved hypothetical protein [Gammaproteobacteria bacterium]
MIYTGLYENVKPRLNDWLNAIGGEVADLALDLCNRARVKIWQEADWEPLIKRVDLTLDAALSVTLPADFGKIINCNFDPLGYGKAIGYYSKDGSLQYGYKIDYPMVVTSGFTAPILTFFFAVPFPPKLVYKATLAAFTGVGHEATFFPEELILRAAQLCHITENGIGNTEYQLIEREYLKELNRYKSQVQGVNADQRQDIKDDAGNIIRIKTADLGGEYNNPRAISPSLDVRYGL